MYWKGEMSFQEREGRLSSEPEKADPCKCSKCKNVRQQGGHKTWAEAEHLRLSSDGHSPGSVTLDKLS